MLPESLLKTFHIAMPGIEVEERADSVLLINRAVGTRVDGPKRLLEMVRFFERARPLGDLPLADKADARALLNLIKNALVMDIGLAFSTSYPTVGEECAGSRFIATAVSCDIAVFGAPIDAATSGGSDARNGPEKIRRAFRIYPWRRPVHEAQVGEQAGEGGETSHASGVGVMLDLEMRRAYASRPRVLDLGNLVYVPGEASDSFGTRVEWLVDKILARDVKPMMLGGDHSITFYALNAFAKKHPSFGLIHFDAHHDTFPSFFPGVTHGNFLSGVLKHEGLKSVMQVGLRAPDWATSESLITDPRIRYASARDVHKLTPAEVFRDLPRDLPYYFTFDVDCMSPQVAPDTGTPVPGGLTYYQALDLVDYAANHFTLAGFDLVEVGGHTHANPASTAADVAARLLFSLLLGGAPYKPLETYLRNEE